MLKASQCFGMQSRLVIVGLLTLTHLEAAEARPRAEVVANFFSTLPRTFSWKESEIMALAVDLALDLPAPHLAIAYDHHADGDFMTYLSITLHHFGIQTSLYLLDRREESTAYLDKLIADVKSRTVSYLDATYFFMATERTSEDLASVVQEEKLGRRNILYIYLWREPEVSGLFQSNIEEVSRVCVITNPRKYSYHMHYNQAAADGRSQLSRVNWWSRRKGFYTNLLLPKSSELYKDMKGRMFIIPVLHKPPWHFVSFENDTIQVEGGRDEKLLSILAEKLNFRYEYFDPPDRSEGSSIVNNTMPGVLGLIWQGEVDIFIGDLTITFERSLVVEFTFFTLSDSEIFLTHAPGKLNEALALVRPFKWEVWPVIIVTVAVSGTLLFSLRKSRLGWHSVSLSELCDSIWVITTIFLRQSLVTKIYGDRARLMVILLYLVATYVIGDIYSANLTSLLTRPAREKPISTLEQLNDAMSNKNYKLLVARHSSSHGVLENGTGLYQVVWNKMKTQNRYLLNTVEEGIEQVKRFKTVALLGGRETFFYNAKRYGVRHFHLSEKLYTRYSAIALRIGCPFIEQFNKQILNMFECGILYKITEDEYQKLREKQIAKKEQTPISQAKSSKEIGEGRSQSEDDETLRAMSMKTLQGAFFVLIVGYSFGGLVLIFEVIYTIFLRGKGH